MGAQPLRLRAVLYPGADEWVAHCLELDLVEAADTPDLALDALLARIMRER
jgi:hypothetical protein